MLATFGRGFYVLDDYSPLREITPQTLAEEARLFPLRDAYLFNPTGLAPAGTAGIGADGRQLDEPQSAVSAPCSTYNVKRRCQRREAGDDDRRRQRTTGAAS